MVYHADSIKYFHSMSVHDVKYIFSQSHRLVCHLRFPLFLGNLKNPLYSLFGSHHIHPLYETKLFSTAF